MVLQRLDGVLRRLVLEFVGVQDGYSLWRVLARRRPRAPALSLAGLSISAPPIIFLDVDGVVNRIGAADERDGDGASDGDDASQASDGDVASDGDNASQASDDDDDYADRIEGRLLRRVQALAASAAPRAVVVLSSDWRAQPDARAYVQKRLERLGVAMVGWTPLARDRAFARPAEILQWLKAHAAEHCGRFVVVDDRDLHRELGGKHLADRFVQTDPKRGFTEANLRAAVEILARPADERAPATTPAKVAAASPPRATTDIRAPRAPRMLTTP